MALHMDMGRLQQLAFGLVEALRGLQEGARALWGLQRPLSRGGTNDSSRLKHPSTESKLIRANLRSNATDP